MKRLPPIVFAASVMSCLAHGAAYYPRLPATVYTHFGWSGEPDATMGKTAALITYYGVVLLVGAAIAAAAAITRRVPRGMLNLPHKAYWLAAERESATRAFLASHLLWMGTASMVLLLVVFQQSYRVSLGLADRLPPMSATLGAFAAFTAAWIAVLLLRFRRPAEARQEGEAR